VRCDKFAPFSAYIRRGEWYKDNEWVQLDIFTAAALHDYFADIVDRCAPKTRFRFSKIKTVEVQFASTYVYLTFGYGDNFENLRFQCIFSSVITDSESIHHHFRNSEKNDLLKVLAKAANP